jgi:imidazoleglycerol phosphate synthase glutamine amidotransferase subunit HisH
MAVIISYIFSKKRKTLLVHNNYKIYKKHTLTENICTWMCINNKCRAKCNTDSEQLIENKNTYFVHTYKEETALNRQKISNSCKRKAVDSVVEKLSKITITYTT